MNKSAFTLALLLGAALCSIGPLVGDTSDPAKPPEKPAEKPAGSAFRTAAVVRGNLTAVVRATGTVEPEEIVEVGAQAAGRIKSFGADPGDAKKDKAEQRKIDYGSLVEEGTVLATLEDSLYLADVDVAKCDLALAKAGVEQADGEAASARAKLDQAARTWERVKKAGPAVAQGDIDAAQGAYEAAKSAVSAADIALNKAKISVDRANAVLHKAEMNLDYCTIKSPVKGVVIDRRANVGQTVGAGLSEPSLFLIAKDLKKLQVWTSVNEADIGNIFVGQETTFTVDARPNKVYAGKVKQIRLNASVTQKVVTYTVVISADNKVMKPNDPAREPALELLPYLTANLQLKVDERKDALLVPNAALRWKPLPAQVAPDLRADYERSLRSKDAPPDGKGPRNRGLVWVEDKDFVRPIKVQPGLTDGVMTEVVEVIDGKLAEGTAVITGQVSRDGGQKPLAPQGLGALGMGPGVLVVQPHVRTPGGASTLTPADAKALLAAEAVLNAAPIVRARTQVVYGDGNWVPNFLYGTTPDYLEVRDWNLADGLQFTDEDVAKNAEVCLVGQTIVHELFAGESPVGKKVRINNKPFTVVGVLSRKGVNPFGQDQDDILLAPWTIIRFKVAGQAAATTDSKTDPTEKADSLNQIYPKKDNTDLYPSQSATQLADTPKSARFTSVDQILVRARSEKDVPSAITQIQEVLRERHHIKPGESDDFRILDLSK